MRVFEKIEAQQKGLENTATWMVGEQLKDILRDRPELQELVDRDLENKGMGLTDCEKKIKAYADKHRTGNFACVPPNVADGIIREFYGLPPIPSGPVLRLAEPAQSDFLSLSDYLDL